MPKMPKGLAPGQTSGRVPSLNKGGGKDKEGNIGVKIQPTGNGSGKLSSGWSTRKGNQQQQSKGTAQSITDSEEKAGGADAFSSGKGRPNNAEEGPMGGTHGGPAKGFATSGLNRQRQGQRGGGPGAEPTGEGPYDEMISRNAKAFATDIKNRNRKIKQNSTVSPRGQKD